MFFKSLKRFQFYRGQLDDLPVGRIKSLKTIPSAIWLATVKTKNKTVKTVQIK